MDIKRYLLVYKTFLKYSLIESTTYRLSFFISMIVEIGYQIVLIVFFSVIFTNVSEIAGWNYNEVLFLTGINIITSELLLGLCYLAGLKHLPEKIKDGVVDFALLRPVQSLFSLSVGRPYFISLISSFSGFFLIFYSLTRLHRVIPLVNLTSGIFVLFCGMLIAYSIIVILSSLTFKFINAEDLPNLAENTITYYKANPHEVYTGGLHTIFFFIIPVVFVGSIPASMIIRSIQWQYLVLAPILAVIFFFIAVRVWATMIRYYSSASS